MTIQMKATEQLLPVVLFIMLYRVVFAFESVNKILNCSHSNELTGQCSPVVLFVMLYITYAGREPRTNSTHICAIPHSAAPK